jgi:hypothetical protein
MEDVFNALLNEEGVEVFGITGAGLSSLVYAAWNPASPDTEGNP